MAVLHFCKYFRYFLLWKPFIIRTDHKPLLQLDNGIEPISHFESRMYYQLSTFEFDVHYRPGKKHSNADALSRVDHAPEPDELPGDGDEEEIAESTFDKVQTIHPFLGYLNSIRKIGPFYLPSEAKKTGNEEDYSNGWWRKKQRDDTALRIMIDHLLTEESGKPELPPAWVDVMVAGNYGRWLHQNYKSIFLDPHGILVYRNKPDIRTKTADKASHVVNRQTDSKLVPVLYQIDLAIKAHEACAHSGRVPTSNYLRLAGVHWPGVQNTVGQIIRSCHPCQTSKPKPKMQRGLYRPTSTGQPWSQLSIDGKQIPI